MRGRCRPRPLQRPRARRATAGSAMSVSASLLAGDPPLADPGALDDPLVGRVDELRQLVVRDAPAPARAAEARDPDPGAVGGADHRSTAKVRVPRAASSSPTCAVALPRPIGPRTASISHVSVSSSPGSTIALEAAVVDAGEEARSCRGSPPRRAPPRRRPAPSPRRSAPRASPAGRGSDRGTTSPRRGPRGARRPGDRAPARPPRREQERVAVREDLLDLLPAERGRGWSRCPTAPAARASGARRVRVALGGADGHAGGGRDLREREAERVLQHEHPRLVGRQAREPVAELGAQLGELRIAGRAGLRRGAAVLDELARSAARRAGRRRRDTR